MLDYRRLEKVRKYAVKMGFSVVETRIFESGESVEAIVTFAPGEAAPAEETDDSAE